MITALCPVLVSSADDLPLAALQHDLVQAGVPYRLGWLVENSAEALRRQEASLPSSWLRRARRAAMVFDAYLAHQRRPAASDDAPLDPFDRGIRSKETLERTWQEASAISRRWRIATALTVDDFERALRGAVESGS